MKKSSYQKLKIKNQNLIEDIVKLINGTWLEQLETEHKWKTQLDLEKIIFGKIIQKDEQTIDLSNSFEIRSSGLTGPITITNPTTKTLYIKESFSNKEPRILRPGESITF